MKEQLIELASNKFFYSASFRVRFLGNPHTYYLWMCELQKWLREKHKIEIVVSPDFDNGNFLGYEFELIEHDGFTQGATFDTYEQALEAGLIEALKLI